MSRNLLYKPLLYCISCLLAVAMIAAFLPAYSYSDTRPDQTSISLTPGFLVFGFTPNVPDYPQTAITGISQIVPSNGMPTWSVIDGTGSGSGWRVTVQGDSNSGKSPVFAQVSGGNYLSSGYKFLPNSLSFSAQNYSFNPTFGSSGTAPSHDCASTLCYLDSSSPMTIAHANQDAGLGSWASMSNGNANSPELRVPASAKAGDYKLDLLWTLSTGP